MTKAMARKWLLLVLVCTSFGLQAQRKPKIKGNRSIIEVNKELPAFHSIQLVDDLVLTLKRTSEPGYTITADDNLIDILKFKVEDSTLIVSSFYQVTAKKKLDITIKYNQLREINLTDGTIRSDDLLRSETLIIEATGFSKVNINADAELVNIQMTENTKGSFNIRADSLHTTLGNKADVNIYYDGYRNRLEMDDAASLFLEGTTDFFSLDMMGNANLKGQNFVAKDIQAILGASSNAKLVAVEQLTLSQRGSSKCYLYGDPKITMAAFSDTSELYKRNK
jgi:autotransporter translocation and assembly factor TamB